eukprot:COSAG05_NODE_717_length_7798_cov_5.545915_6_plen_249_part_00
MAPQHVETSLASSQCSSHHQQQQRQRQRDQQSATASSQLLSDQTPAAMDSSVAETSHMGDGGSPFHMGDGGSPSLSPDSVNTLPENRAASQGRRRLGSGKLSKNRLRVSASTSQMGDSNSSSSDGDDAADGACAEEAVVRRRKKDGNSRRQSAPGSGYYRPQPMISCPSDDVGAAAAATGRVSDESSDRHTSSGERHRPHSVMDGEAAAQRGAMGTTATQAQKKKKRSYAEKMALLLKVQEERGTQPA